MIRVNQIVAVAFLAAIWCGTAVGGTLSGSIRNGTNGKAGAGLDVILIQLQGGMQPVATVKSDGEGHFSFDRPEIGAAPMLIRVNYRGVNYHQPVPPGTPSVAVEIFEPTDKQSAIVVTGHDIVLQPSGTTLLIGEEFTIENNTTPPVAYFRNEGTFDFLIPEGATLGQVSAWSSAGMPVVQGTIDKGKNHDAIAFPFRPGKNGVRISYQLPYSGQATVKMTPMYASKSVLLVAPPAVQISAAGFAAAGQQDGWSIYGHDEVAANTPLQISIAGTGPAPGAADANAGGGDGGAGAGGAGGGGGANDPSVNSRATGTGETVAMPERLENLKWILVGGFAALFALGVVFLWRRPQGVMAAAGAAGVIEAPAAPPARSSAARTAAPASVAPSAASATVAQVDTEVRGSLDDLKEKIFRLELRHQAGTISDDEYQQQRAQVERTLRDLVRG